MRLSYFKNSDYIMYKNKYNVVTCESVACRSYFTNKSFRAVCARSLICVYVRASMKAAKPLHIVLV